MWAGLGIDARTLQNRPGPNTYPPVFTPNCKVHWEAAVNELPQEGEASALWTEVIQDFIVRCRQANTSPFLGLQQSRNDQIVSALRNSRRAVLKVLDNAKVFRMITLKAVHRSCKVTGQGFVLRVQGDIQAADPTVTRWLLQKPWPAFHLKSQGVYRKQLDHNTQMIFYNSGANMPLRWHIGYEIALDILPALPNQMASNAEIETFVLKVLWHHVMLDTRTREWHRRKI